MTLTTPPDDRVGLYRELSSSLQADAAEFGDELQLPASEADANRIRTEARRELGAGLPEAYVSLLRYADGLDYDGNVIFASRRGPLAGHPDRTIEGVVEANLDWRDLNPEDYSGLLVLGEANGTQLVQDLVTGRFQVLDPVGFTVFEEFETFEELVHHVFTELAN